MTVSSDATHDTSGWGVLDDLPGHPMMWVLIFSELTAFGLLLGAFAVARAVDPAGFAADQTRLDVGLAGLNTLVLIASGWLAARAAIAARSGRRAAVRGLTAGAIALGALFIGIKLVEYGHEIAGGADPETSTFFTLYFLLTGFHLLHVGLGMVILAVVGWRAAADDVETGAAFWHMVDLVWLVMMPSLYLIR
ncbi:cytochrome c oxidase subunit 3 family protein [Rhodoplanes serenus]|uniref:Cytochrome c oxidase subunit 3 family protein n=1 Tax=Rhodoplanes serenus TaxID=200615 RepID=A0A9X4XM00_9BRAD|nr:cytochrome c oxidase subunit 3 [Rhodoplanes serenus]MTW16019.1 cytochrome c oxidase subunit 3 family protein [Rhodoplanes serenus]